jgi:nucleoid-associated protein YgaU
VDPFQGFSVYTVRSGDTLSAIADEFYGDPAKFRIIFAANREVIDDPDVIVPGQVLRIPQ